MSATMHQCSIMTPTTQQERINGKPAEVSLLPHVHESLYRFFPDTEGTKERVIEDLNPQIFRLCSSNPLRDKGSISNARRQVIENIYHNPDNFGTAVERSPPPAVEDWIQITNDEDTDTNPSGVQFPRSDDLAPSRKPQCKDSRGKAEQIQLVFLVRHGQTDMNAAGRLQGRGINAQLNQAGQRQADELGEFLRNVPFGRVMSSPLDRAHETALRVASRNIHCLERGKQASKKVLQQADGENAVDALPSYSRKKIKIAGTGAPDADVDDRVGCVVLQKEGFAELSWGVLEGQLSAQEPWKGKLAALKRAWDDGQFDLAAEEGENLLQVEARARAAMEELLDEGHDLNLVASHGRTLRILLLSLAGLGLDQMTRMGKIPNTGLYIIEARRSQPGAPRSYRLLTPTSSQ